MLGLSPWITLSAVLAAGVLAWTLGRRAPDEHGWSSIRTIERALDHRRTPAIVGALTAAIIWYVWGGLNRFPVVHDEAAYVFQAQLFARDAWTAPAPALPEFFEQLYLLLTPAMTAKYPPGHSLLLSLGAFLGFTGLSVILLNGISGALIFALARRVASSRAAVLTWLAWISCFPAIYFRASYLSEVTTTAAWLSALWCLLRWRETRSRSWLIGVAIGLGIFAITRPLTAVALAIPIAAVVLHDTWTRHAWRDLVRPLLVGAAIVAIIPLWSAQTTGSPLVSPIELYTRLYIPFDKIGFGADTTRPLRGVLRDRELNQAFFDEHRTHTVAALPHTLADRSRMIARDTWYEWRIGLAPFAVIGLVALSAAGWFAVASLLAHVAVYLLYAHKAFWTIYYLETETVLVFVTALGVARFIDWMASAGRKRTSPASDAPLSSRIAVLALAIVAGVPAARTVQLMRAQVDADHSYFERFDALVKHIPDRSAIVFVRYAPSHNVDLSLVRNSADNAHARVWLVHDRGADNARLVAHTPQRTPYLFDEATWTLTPLTRP